jgi:hypothetical protein
MKNSIRFFVGLSLMTMIVCYGCGVENSEAEMKAAQQAMDSAKNIHADELAALDWSGAMQAWEQGQAAVKEGKSAKTFFLRAKSRFEKAAKIATPMRDRLSKDVSDRQTNIEEGIAKAKTALQSGKLNPKVQKQIKPIVAEVESGIQSIEDLVSQGDFIKARTTAEEVGKKVYNIQLIMAGKKPVS